MRYDYSTVFLTGFLVVYFLVENTKGKSLGQGKELANINEEGIKDLRQDLRKVLYFLDLLSEDNIRTNQTLDKNRSHIPVNLRNGEYLLEDESVVKATAKKAAKAVKESLAATLKTQKGVKQISKGLVQLKNCLKAFENAIKV